jgi:hypothetical protein
MQLVGKLLGQHGMMAWFEITECVFQRQLLLFRRQYILATRGMVHSRVIFAGGRKFGGDAVHNILSEFFKCHMLL